MISHDTRKRIVRNMLESRCLDERLILLQRHGLGHFWTGGPGEEAFNSCLGAMLHVGRGPNYDYLLPHYRSSAIALMAGEQSIDFIRQMLGRESDPYSSVEEFIERLQIPVDIEGLSVDTRFFRTHGQVVQGDQTLNMTSLVYRDDKGKTTVINRTLGQF